MLRSVQFVALTFDRRFLRRGQPARRHMYAATAAQLGQQTLKSLELGTPLDMTMSYRSR